MERIIKRGDIYYAELNPIIGSEQGGTRPVLIISNDIGNKHSPTVIIILTLQHFGKGKRLTSILLYRWEMISRKLRRRLLSASIRSSTSSWRMTYSPLL